jgi:hypothetical protein
LNSTISGKRKILNNILDKISISFVGVAVYYSTGLYRSRNNPDIIDISKTLRLYGLKAKTIVILSMIPVMYMPRSIAWTILTAYKKLSLSRLDYAKWQSTVDDINKSFSSANYIISSDV